MSKRLSVDPIAEAKRQWAEHGWGDAANGMTTVTSIIRGQQLMLARVEGTLRPYGLSFARYELLRLLAFSREGHLPLSSAIARLQVHPTSVSNTVERLRLDGLVLREQHPEDGRAAMLILTPAGRELVDTATLALNEVFIDLGMPEDDEIELVRILARYRKGAGDFADPATPPTPL
jgi:DNA-binding MarR family transcriptional regulator